MDGQIDTDRYRYIYIQMNMYIKMFMKCRHTVTDRQANKIDTYIIDR